MIIKTELNWVRSRKSGLFLALRWTLQPSYLILVTESGNNPHSFMCLFLTHVMPLLPAMTPVLTEKADRKTEQPFSNNSL